MDNKDDEKVTVQMGIHGGSINKNGRTYNFNTVQEELRKHQLSSIYEMFGEYGTFDKTKEIKVSRIEDLDDRNGFKPGYLYCFERQLEGSLCEKCESREQCIKDEDYTNQTIRRIREKDGD